MRNPEYVYQFVNGTLQVMQDVPSWLTEAMATEKKHNDRQRALADIGADHVESYGRLNETLDVWKLEDQAWVVDYWDTDSQIMAIVIENIVDFMTFQAAWISPLALKIMTADKYLAEQGADFSPEYPETVDEVAEKPQSVKRVKVPALH